MGTRVNILVTVRKPELLRAGLLVFRTLRVGFPEAAVRVRGNNLPSWAAGPVSAATREAGGEFYNLPAVSHDGWIEGLVQTENEGFWVLDTDVVFWGPMDKKTEGEPEFRGRWEPEFLEEWTGTRHMERLHTAVMWIDPCRLRAQMRAWMARIPAPWGHTGEFPFILQHFVPARGAVPMFYDTMAGCYQAGMGERFSEEEDARFEHLHCGTYVDLVSKAESLRGLPTGHEMIYQNLEAARGLRERQNDYYESRRISPKDLSTPKMKRKEPSAV